MSILNIFKILNHYVERICDEKKSLEYYEEKFICDVRKIIVISYLKMITEKANEELPHKINIKTDIEEFKNKIKQIKIISENYTLNNNCIIFVIFGLYPIQLYSLVKMSEKFFNNLGKKNLESILIGFFVNVIISTLFFSFSFYKKIVYKKYSNLFDYIIGLTNGEIEYYIKEIRKEEIFKYYCNIRNINFKQDQIALKTILIILFLLIIISYIFTFC